MFVLIGEKGTLKSGKIFSLVVLFMMLIILQFANASPALSITLAPDKWVYSLGATVVVKGNLTRDGFSVTDGLVGLQIDDPNDNYFVLRTLPTGPPPSGDWIIEILDVIPSDSLGNPKQTFARGQRAYFNISLRNNDEVSRFVCVFVNIFDANSFPVRASIQLEASIPPSSSSQIFFYWMIPEEIALGNAVIYVSAFNELPRNLGHPYCPEKSAVFTIESPTNPPSSPSFPAGTYGLAFKLSGAGKVGACDIYATSRYEGEWVYASTQFSVIPLQADINGDGAVDIFDALILSGVFGSTVGDPGWYPDADLLPDGVIDVFDALILAGYFGEGGT